MGNFTRAILTVFLVGGGLGHANAQEVVQAPDSLRSSPAAQLAFPGTFGVPSAVAPRPNSGFFGASYANPRGGVDGAGGDGDIVAGYTIGNPLTAISLTFGVALTGIDPLGDAGSFSISASRLLRAAGASATFLGLSVSNLGAWGVNEARSEMTSIYVSHLMGVKSGGAEIPMQFTIGYGTDNTRDSAGTGTLEDGVFAGFGIGLTQDISAGISATETQINIGATLSLPQIRSSLTVGVLDATNNTDRQQISVSVGYGF